MRQVPSRAISPATNVARAIECVVAYKPPNPLVTAVDKTTTPFTALFG
jgi:hypothetical protein